MKTSKSRMGNITARVIAALVMGVKKKDLPVYLSTTKATISRVMNTAEFNGYLSWNHFPTKKGMQYAEEVLGDGQQRTV